MTAFSGNVLIDSADLQLTVARIASRRARASLLAAFTRGSDQVRDQLGADTVPRPIVILRTFAIGYRIDRYSKDAATVAIWNVGVIGSGATVQPQQSWGTEHVSLVWQNNAWKVTGFASERGPTPPLTNAEAADSASDLFTQIPTFTGFGHAAP